MSENEPDSEVPTENESAPEASPPPVAAPRHRRRWPWVVAAVIASPILVIGIWTAIALSYTYSSGERAGYVQKFSRKGWLCKTWEGELAMVNVPGAMQERWQFSVRNDSIAQVITNSMGNRVSLSYDQHRGIPTDCFGETEYFVTGIRVLGQ
jgi:hypothetical protein